MARVTAKPISAIARSCSIASTRQEWLISVAPRLPRPLRFLLVGGLGLAAEIFLFTLMLLAGIGPLLAGFVALVAATVLTWRLNRLFTFARSGRTESSEAMRYALVTVLAQSTSYIVFAVLVSGVLASFPQVAIVVGAGCGALVSYNGHRLFAFAPVQGCAHLPRC
jgi:putative flippase GtrA